MVSRGDEVGTGGSFTVRKIEREGENVRNPPPK